MHFLKPFEMRSLIIMAVMTLFLQACHQSKLLVAIKPLITSSEQIMQDISFMAQDKLEGRLVGTEGEKMAAEYIASRFLSLGLSTFPSYQNYQQDYVVHKKPNPHSLTPTGDVSSQNVIGYIDNKSDQYVIIGAHYDHLGYGHFGTLWDGDPAIHNGADDNASGVAVMLEIAKQLINGPNNNNYVFMAFSGEELGLWGSNYWVKNPSIDLGKINYMINLDMVGRLNAERSVAINGTGTSPVWDKKLDQLNRYNFNIVKSASGVGPSDHTSFYNNNIPVLHFFTGQHKDYHKPSDDVEFINAEGTTEIGSYILDIIYNLDSEKKLTFSKTKDESTEVPDFKVTLGVMPDYLFNGKGMRIDGLKEGRPAFKADMKKGDIVVKIDTLDIDDMMSYMKALGQFEPGDTVPIMIMREGKTMKKLVTF